MLTTRTETLTCIPHREPFIAVHEIIRASEDAAETQFEIETGSVFEINGAISEAGLIENMAQTAAAQMGYYCRQQNLPVPLGYLASIKHLVVHFLPLAGTIVKTSVAISNRIMDVVLLDAIVRQKDRDVCRCEMRVFIKSSS